LAALALFAGGGTRAAAGPVARSYTVTVVSGAAGGPFAGQAFTGEIGYDNSTGHFDPQNPNVFEFDLTSFSFHGFFGRDFTLADVPGAKLSLFGGEHIVAEFFNGDFGSNLQAFEFSGPQNTGHLFRYFTPANASGGPFVNGFLGDVTLSAEHVVRPFTVTIVPGAAGGPFAGQAFTGEIDYDPTTGHFDPDNPNVFEFDLTSFSFHGFFGRDFTLADVPGAKLVQFGGSQFIVADFFNGDFGSNFQAFEFNGPQNTGHLFRYFTPANASGGPFVNGFLGDVTFPAPEPSSLALFALGGLGLAGCRLWKRRCHR
jgi:hypothetical protein